MPSIAWPRGVLRHRLGPFQQQAVSLRHLLGLLMPARPLGAPRELPARPEDRRRPEAAKEQAKQKMNQRGQRDKDATIGGTWRRLLERAQHGA
eukprot:9833442-Alexandrium_andersonii.AAC.1